MNNEFERMKCLLSDLGLSFENGGITNAEIYSYAAGLEFIKSSLQDVLNKIFINVDGNDNLLMYMDLLNIDADDYSDENIKNAIYKRLAHKYGEYTQSGFDEAFHTVGSGEYKISDGLIIFSNVNKKDLKRLAKFIKGYVFLPVQAVCDGSGLDFDSWDSWGQSFHTYDNMKLTFDIIDTLRSDIIE